MQAFISYVVKARFRAAAITSAPERKLADKSVMGGVSVAGGGVGGVGCVGVVGAAVAGGAKNGSV